MEVIYMAVIVLLVGEVVYTLQKSIQRLWWVLNFI